MSEHFFRCSSRDLDICRHTRKMITPGNSSRFFIVFLTAVTGIDNNRPSSCPFPEGFQQVQKPGINYNSFAAGTFKFIEHKMLRYPNVILGASQHLKTPAGS